MDRPRAAPTRRREGLVLALGLVSAALLAGAALAPFSDPELAGRAAFARLAGGVEDGVAAEWERMLAEGSLGGVPLARWTSDEAAQVSMLPEEVAAPEPEPRLSSFEVLLGEALRFEGAGDARGALDAVLEALDKDAPNARRGLARLVAVRAARALADPAVCAAQWSAARAELDGSEVSDGLPLLAACALAAAPCLDGAGREQAQLLVVEAWTSGRLALGAGPLREVLAERVVELAPGSSPAERLRAYEKKRRLATLAATLPDGQLPPRPQDPLWHLRELQGTDELLAWRAEGADGVVACRVAPHELVGRLVARAERDELVPTGFRLDFGLGGSVAGEPVRERRALARAGLGFTLRHADPGAAMRAEGGRLALLRIALLAVAVLTVVASLATFRALRRGRRLAELKSAFVANVSHELRTPLASILMLAENLESGRVVDEDGRARYHGLIRREAERLRRLVADVLDFSRLESGKPLELRRDEIELADFMAGLAAEARAWAGRHGLELQVEQSSVEGRARLDAEALRRAVLNLLDNARKHSGARAIALSAAVGKGTLALGVEDHGRGVPAAVRATVFEPFARLEGANGAAGAGLGLAIVREIARSHGGDVALSTPSGGAGARFELRIPLHCAAAAEEVHA